MPDVKQPKKRNLFLWKRNAAEKTGTDRRWKMLSLRLVSTGGVLACAGGTTLYIMAANPRAASPATPASPHTLSAQQTSPMPPELSFDAVNQYGNKAGYIAHAFGEINGTIYTNSLEAFNLNYSRGFRVFECDFVYLKDGTVFVAHDAHEAEYGLTKPFPEATRADIAQVRQEGVYTPLTSEGIVDLMRQHPDVLLMLDTKMNHVDIIRRLVQDAGGDRNVLDRMVPHISDQANYDAVMAVYPFKYTMLALYRMLPLQPSNEDEIVAFVRKNHITAVMFNRKEDDPTLAMINNGAKPGSFSFASFHAKLQAAGIPHYAHSVGNRTEVERFRTLGVGVYMDIPIPN